MDSETSVRVAVRVRPLVGIETEKKCVSAIQYPQPKQVQIGKQLSGADRAFTYDYVFDEQSTQTQIYEESISPLVKGFLGGYNGTILAYGQTGSGKTHTMGTDGKTQAGDPSNFGIIPRVISEIFECIDESKDKEFEMKVQFLEIHNEQILDLLNPVDKAKHGGLPIRELMNGEIAVAGAVEEAVVSGEQTLRCLERGSACRQTASTNMNSRSSRSHAIFTILLTQRKLTVEEGREEDEKEVKQGDEEGEEGGSGEKDKKCRRRSDVSEFDDDDDVVVSKFHFVDLAGSERLKRTGAIGQRMKEGININCGLLALANVISALSDEKRKGGHVPFRDSKITRMLQDSLGGNSKTIMIACVSPADVNTEESLNTLRYANRARNIKNKPVINRDPQQLKIARMRSRIRELEALLALQGGTVPSSGLHNAKSMTAVSNEEYALLRDQSLVYEQEIIRLGKRLQESKINTDELSEQLQLATQERDSFGLRLQKIVKKHNIVEKELDGTDKEFLASLSIDREMIEQLQAQVRSLQKDLKEKDLQLREYVEPETIEKPTSTKTGQNNVLSDTEMELVKEDPTVCADVEHLSTLSDVRGRAHTHQMNQLTRVARNLENDIKDKQMLMKQLVEQKEQSNAMHAQYIVKIGKMEQELIAVQKQRDAHNKSSTNNTALPQNQKLRASYETKISGLNKKLAQMRAKMKENTGLRQKLVKDERKITKLQSEIEKAKKNKVRLQQQMNSKADAYRTWMNEKENNIKQLLKQARQNAILVGKMKNAAAKQSLVLKRKNENEAMLRKKLDLAKSKAANAQTQRAKSRLTKTTKPPTNKRTLSSTFNATSGVTTKTKKPKLQSSLSVPSRPPSKPSFSTNTRIKSTQFSVYKRTPLSNIGNNKNNTTSNKNNNKENILPGKKNTLGSLIKKRKLEGGSKDKEKEKASKKSGEVKVNENQKVDISDNMARLTKELILKLNTASLKELMTLQMIGKKRAESIIDEREEKEFESLEDLRRVKLTENGINQFLKQNMMNKIWDQQDMNVLSAR